jgi:type II secretory pathway predicted ATPase ExeA
MYENFFGFRARPFPATPDTTMYVPLGTIQEAMRALTRLVERDEGVGLIVGAAGMGKTLLCQLLAEHFQDRFATVMLGSGRLTSRRALLQHLLFALKLPYRQMDDGELRLTLLDYLEVGRGQHAGILLLLDEAHTLPQRVLEEVRLISNLVRGGVTRVRLILAGHTILEERLSVPRLEALNQRIAVRCYLSHLNAHETAEFMRQQIIKAGGVPEKIFSRDAYAAVARFTDGVPRLINQLCDHALVIAYADERLPIDATLIDEAWCDLQRLPLRRLGDAQPTGASPGTSVIEFGLLDESQDGGTEDVKEAPPLRPVPRRTDTDAANTVHGDGNFVASTLAEESTGGSHSAIPVATASEAMQTMGAVSSTVGTDQDARPTRDCESQQRAKPQMRLAIDPFAEPFAEEEIVLDRFAEAPLRTLCVNQSHEPTNGRSSLPAEDHSAERCVGGKHGVQDIVTHGAATHGAATHACQPQRAGDSENVGAKQSDQVAATRSGTSLQSTQGPIKSAVSVDTPNDVEEQLLQETLKVLWGQPIIAAHCLSGQ